MIKVSVIVPVYNAQKYLKDCVESLVHQTLEEIELIFVNDGSTDDSLKILEAYQEEYPQKVHLITKENGGQASARNMGIVQANGKYIGFVDADDYVAECMYEKMYSLAEQEQSDYVECRYQYLKVEKQGKVIKLPCYGNVRPYGRREEMFLDPLVSPWNKLYRTRILKDNHITFPEGVVYEDTAFYVKAIPYIHKTSYECGEYVYHFLRDGSTMNDKNDERVGQIFPVLQNAIEFYRGNDLFETYQKELEYFCVKILLCSSLSRIAKVSRASLRRQYEEETIFFIRENFPKYRKNSYIRDSRKGMYMRCMNRITMRMIVWLLKYRKDS